MGLEGVVGLRAVVITMLASVLAMAPAAAEPIEFSDVPEGHVFADEIVWLAEEGITRGCNPPDNDRFCPDGVVTRGQMAAFLSRAFDLTDRGDVDFTDDDDSVFEPDIERLAVAGITLGCNPPTNDRFCPAQPVTRGQMAAFLERALELTAIDPEVAFVDAAGSVFAPSINRLATAGITRGCNPPTNDRFCPEQSVTRAQMAAFLHRAFPADLKITTTMLPGGTTGGAYSATLEAQWGLAPYTWAAAGVPDGITLSSDGTFTGAPLAAGEPTLSVQVTDGRGQADTASISIDIDDPLEILSDALPRWKVDGYKHFRLTSTGGELGQQWTSTELPAGITMNSFGAITGRPTEVGLFPITWTVTDTDGRVASIELVLEVVDTLHVIAGDLVDGTVGEAYSAPTTAVGGLPPYTWDATGLPDGLSVADDGVIVGTPTASGTFLGSVSVTDTEANTVKARVTIYVYQPLVVVTDELPLATVGKSWWVALDADGGKGQHHWSGEVPAGLSLADHGFLSGYPEEAGDQHFVVQVSDEADRTAQQSFVLEAREPVEITTTSLPGGTTWETYSAQLAASGGHPPYTWWMGSDPAGLNIDDDGRIYGAPLTHGPFEASFQVTDASGRTASASLLIDVDLPLEITTTELIDARLYTTYAKNFSASGGEKPYTWSASTVPDGMLVTSHGQLQGIPDFPGVQDVTVTVTDADGRSTTVDREIFISGMVRVSQSQAGVGGNGECTGGSISGDGRFVLVECAADNFVAGDNNGQVDVYRHDRETKEMVWVSADPTNVRTDGAIRSVIDFDGDVAGFTSWSDNVVPGDDNGWADAFVYDAATGSVVRISEAADGTGGNRGSSIAAVSDDGEWVMFGGGATNIVPGDTTVAGDVFFHNTVTGALTIEGLTAEGVQPPNGAAPSDLSGDGRFFVFTARGIEFDPHQSQATSASVFMRDRITGSVTLISDTYDGSLMTSGSFYPVVDYDGSNVAYLSYSDNILPQSVFGRGMIYHYETATGITRLVSKATDGAVLDAGSSSPHISADGRFVVYGTVASNASPQPNNIWETYVWDLHTESTTRLSLDFYADAPNGSTKPLGISADGKWVVLMSEASDLMLDDDNGVADIFVAAVDTR